MCSGIKWTCHDIWLLVILLSQQDIYCCHFTSYEVKIYHKRELTFAIITYTVFTGHLFVGWGGEGVQISE